MNQFLLWQFLFAHGGGIEPRYASRKFQSVQIANPHDVADREVTFAT